MTSRDNGTDIFLSYASQRRRAATHLAQTLQAYGYNVWFDYQLIEGRDFAFQLDQRLRATRVALVLWCSKSVDSRWVHEEADLAESLNRLLPVMMETCELKLGTRRLQYEDLRDWDGDPASHTLEPLLSAIARMTGKAPVLNHPLVAEISSAWVSAGRPRFQDYPVSEKRLPGIGAKIRTEEFSSPEAEPPRGAREQLSRGLAHSLMHPGYLTIGVFPYPPLSVGDDPEAMSGPWIMLAKEVARGLGLAPRFRLTSFADLLENAYSTVDVVISVFDTPRRRKWYEFSKPVNRIGLLGLCKEEHQQILEDDILAGRYKVLVQEGEAGWEYMHDEAPRAVELKRVTSVDALEGTEVLSLLRTGRYDVALMDGLTCLHFMSDPATSVGLRLAMETPLNMFDCGVAIRRTSGLKVTEVDRLVSEIRNEPAYRELEQASLKGFERIVKRVGLK